MASLAHLSALVTLLGLPGVLGPLVVLLAARDDPFVHSEAKEALNFNLSVLIYAIAAAALAVPGIVLTLGLAALALLPLALAAAVAWLVLAIVGGVRASQGQGFRYPLTIRFLA
ncbi:DUF4870 domain-containing protein [Egibacter rhizosphaerae]|uniref:DUF4870 domain-containing protein n=1 Tax=Egibacter rhizosphaerae TaxID=1670831 RepID=A0A411YLK1_9ACTN|nr:DUF4870 domain-containing protein [Egibacter rhizosphaerae]